MIEQIGPIVVGFPAEKSIPEWERRHADGEVPGRWPYGLDGLSAYTRVSPVNLPLPSRADRIRSRLHLGPRADRRSMGLTWDENAALRMATVRPHQPHFSGVIWLTDAAARGRDLGRMPGKLAQCSALWVLSAAQIEPLRRLVPGVPVVQVPFGIDHEFFSARPTPDALRVVSVGGDRDRDADTLFRALARVHDARPDVELVVQTTSEATPPKGVSVIRHLPHAQLRELYASASVVAIATRPNLHVSGMTVSLEAMATGRPVAMTRTPGMDDYVVDGETGLLSEPGDEESLAASVLALLADRVGAATMGAAGRAFVDAAHTSAHMNRAIVEIIRDHA